MTAHAAPLPVLRNRSGNAVARPEIDADQLRRRNLAWIIASSLSVGRLVGWHQWKK
jgi:hypothetical protein